MVDVILAAGLQGAALSQQIQLNQLAALQAQAAAQQQQQQQQTQQRLQQGAAAAAAVRGMYPAGLNPMATGQNARSNFGNTLSAAVTLGAISRSLSPQPQIAQPLMSLAKHGNTFC